MYVLTKKSINKNNKTKRNKNEEGMGHFIVGVMYFY